jgi:hypothetical protein
MRNVVIFTGALRTVKKTIRYFKQNVLRDNVDVFLCVQNDTQQPDEEWTTWFSEQMGSHMKSIEWFSLTAHPEWITHRDAILQNIQLDNGWKDYLRTSGSMIEYFQLQLAHMKVCLYEQTHGFQYDYLVRARTDSIYAKPVDFHWLTWTDAEVAERVQRIKEEMTRSEIEVTERSLLQYFMATVISDTTIPNMTRIFADYVLNDADRPPIGVTDTPYETALNQYLKQGRYILTIRKNNLYVIRRDLFFMIPSLGTMYGLPRSPAADDYWFNAECQFRSACYYSGISIFDYSSLFEEKSLEYPNNWCEADFFDLEFNLINPTMLYCIVRK